MQDLVDYLSCIIRLSGGEVVGKTRLQKMAYLLEAKGVGFGNINFDYHSYGPFSAELAFAADDAESLGYIETEERSGFHEIPYTVFKATEKEPEIDDGAETETRKAAIEVMGNYTALELELAATAVYLKKNGYLDGCWEEVQKRKPLKATSERIERAKQVIADLNL